MSQIVAGAERFETGMRSVVLKGRRGGTKNECSEQRAVLSWPKYCCMEGDGGASIKKKMSLGSHMGCMVIIRPRIISRYYYWRLYAKLEMHYHQGLH